MSGEEEGWRRRLENIREELHTNSLQFSLLKRSLFLTLLKLFNINKAQTGPQEHRDSSRWPGQLISPELIGETSSAGKKWAMQE